MAVPTLTANSPVSGSIAWSAFSIQYGGVSYNISAGSTANRYVWWLYNAGSPVITAGMVLPNLTADDLLLFVNKAGIPINVPKSTVVDGSLIVDGTIVGTAIVAGTVHGDRIQGDTITANEIAANAITASELAADSVIAAKIKAGEVVAGKLAADSVVTANIAAGQITATKIAADTITANEIAANAITASELAADSVIAAKIKAGEVVAGKLAADSVVTANIAAGQITAAKIATDTITANQIAANAITATELAADSVTSTKIQADAVTSTKIAADAITAREIAAGAITASELSVGAVTATSILAGALNGQTITGAVIRTSEAYPRTELTSDLGIRQYAADQTMLTSIGGSSGNNKFTGSVDATDMLVRDSLQVFGTNNLMAVGSKWSLRNSIAKPSQPPTAVPDIPASVGQTWTDPNWIAVGAHADTDTAASWKIAAKRVDGDYGVMLRNGANYRFLQRSTPSGYAIAPLGYTRVRTASGAMRGVLIGTDADAPIGNYGYPITTWVIDDSNMTPDGLTEPVITYSTNNAEHNDASTFYSLGRCFVSASASDTTVRRDWITEAWVISNGNGASPQPANIKVRTLTVSDTGVTPRTSWKALPTQTWGPGEYLVGCAFGSSARMGFFAVSGIPDQDVWVIHTNRKTYVFQDSNSAYVISWGWNSSSSGTTAAMFTMGSLATTTAWGGFWKMSTEQNTAFGFTDYYPSQPYSAKYTWRGHSSTTYESTASDATASLYGWSRWGVRVSVPALPAPIAGVGAARDPAKDAYGWKLYISSTANQPANTFFPVPVQPTGDPTLITSLGVYGVPPSTGSNPPLTSNFPLSTPASIENETGTLKISGDGTITATDILGGAIDKIYDLVVPVGTVIANFTGTTPYKCLKLTSNPVAVSRTTYATLYAALGGASSPFGQGNGTTTFDLPRVSGKALIGVGSSDTGSAGNIYTLGQKVGHEALPSHTHSGTTGNDAPDHTHGYEIGWSEYGALNWTVGTGSAGTNRNIFVPSQQAVTYGRNQFHQHPFTTGPAGAGDSGNLSPHIGTHFFIRY